MEAFRSNEGLPGSEVTVLMEVKRTVISGKTNINPPQHCSVKHSEPDRGAKVDELLSPNRTSGSWALFRQTTKQWSTSFFFTETLPIPDKEMVNTIPKGDRQYLKPLEAKCSVKLTYRISPFSSMLTAFSWPSLTSYKIHLKPV